MAVTMTDHRGRPRGLSTAALLAPAVAAAFGGSVAWAADHPPAAVATPKPAVRAETGDDTAKKIQDRQRAVERIRKEIASLQFDVDQGKGAPSRPVRSRTDGTSAATPRGSAKPKPAPDARAKTAAPPIHATTGAS
jgi:hypothetical protein